MKHEFIHIADYDKIKPLLLLYKEFKKHANKHRTSCVVFCNSVNSARAIEHALAEKGVKTSALHGEIPSKIRMRNYIEFRKRETNVLVATDLASRGLDMPWISHVINFDFPKSTSDYLHRAGRAGRAGREGWVLSMYREKDQPILNEMKISHDTKEPLKIRGSAYSLKNKEEIIAQRKAGIKAPRHSVPKLGHAPKGLIAAQ